MSQPDSDIKKPKRRWLRCLGITALILLCLLLCFLGWFIWAFSKYYGAFLNGFMPPEMAQARHAPRDVVGNLGGMTVSIPRHFAEFVEYDGDPGFGEKRKGPRPVRTHESRLRGFGFEVRYPDMAGLSSEELRKEQRSYNIYKTPWISVGFNTGENYPKDGFLDRRTESTLRGSTILKYENYEKLPHKQHGLTVYVPTGIDPKTQQPYRYDRHAKDVFINRDAVGSVTTYIKCANVSKGVHSCQQTFNLEPKAKAVVYVSYRRDMLPEWKNIQESVRKLVFSFEVQAPANDADSTTHLKP